MVIPHPHAASPLNPVLILWKFHDDYILEKKINQTNKLNRSQKAQKSFTNALINVCETTLQSTSKAHNFMGLRRRDEALIKNLVMNWLTRRRKWWPWIEKKRDKYGFFFLFFFCLIENKGWRFLWIEKYIWRFFMFILFFINKIVTCQNIYTCNEWKKWKT